MRYTHTIYRDTEDRERQAVTEAEVNQETQTQKERETWLETHTHIAYQGHILREPET